MIIRYGSAKIVKVAATLQGLVTPWGGQGLVKRASQNLESLDLDPGKNVYLRNRAVSALELHGPNQNWDAFEHDELQAKYSTFIGNDISVDHIGTDKIGTVLDSEFIPSHVLKSSLGVPMMPLEATIKSLNGLCSRDKDTFSRVFDYANKQNLVRGSDQKRMVEAVCQSLANSGWVENIWAIDKELGETHTAGMVKAILAGKITDSSMGAMVDKSVCSVCGNVATGELPEHEDFCDCIRLFKGTPMPINGVVVIPFEINRDIEFFEDALILPHQFGGQAGGEGADKDAKLLEVFAKRKKCAAKEKKAFGEDASGNQGSQLSQSPNIYVMIGDTPDIVDKNKSEFIDEKKEIIQDHIDEQSAPGKNPEGTILNIRYEDNDVDAVVVDEFDDGTLVVAIEGIDDPVEITIKEINEVVEYPEEISYKHKMDINDVRETERHPEKRSASLTK